MERENKIRKMDKTETNKKETDRREHKIKQQMY